MSTPEFQELEKRLSTLEAKADSQSEQKQKELAAGVMSGVIDIDKHLDDKASRILSAMAFLTAAAAAIFAKAYSPSLTTEQVKDKIRPFLTPDVVSAIEKSQWDLGSATIGGTEWSVITFSVYMLFVLVGSVLYLSALGPFLNIPKAWKLQLRQDRSQNKDEKLSSLLFFYFISEVNPQDWEKYWKEDRTVDQLQSEITDNYIGESLKIAQNAKTKYNFMSVGNWFFVIAIFCLIALIGGLLTQRNIVAWLFTCLGWAVLSVVIAITSTQRPPKEKFPPTFWVWAALSVISILSAIILACRSH
ncbi:MAG: hypothetical protein JST84_05575 [Acidobacteria bacterium]|nr:hypothetical protein [Acidobacteriota bacterium]